MIDQAGLLPNSRGLLCLQLNYFVLPILLWFFRVVHSLKQLIKILTLFKLVQLVKLGFTIVTFELFRLVAESELMLVSEQHPFTFSKHDLVHYLKSHHLPHEAQDIELRSNLLFCLSEHSCILASPAAQRRGTLGFFYSFSRLDSFLCRL